MSSITDTSDSSTLQSLLDDAVKQYQAKVGASLIEHQLAIRLRSCHTIESINQVLEEQVQPFRKSLGNDRHPKMTKSILRTVNVLHTVFTGSGTALRGLQGAIQAGHGVASVSIPSIKLVFSAIGILLAAVKDVNASYDLLFELFESLGNFVQRLDIYTQASPTMALRKVVVKIIIEMLSTLALATKQIKQGRLKKFGLKLFGENKVEEALKKLDKLIQEEVRATAAQTLGAVSRLEQNTSRLEQNTRVIMDGETSHAKKEKADQIRRDLQHWLSPPNPWKNHNTACAARHDGTTTWLTQSDALVNWQSSGSLLWVCGKPGAGKTVLCSSIIEYIDSMRKSGSASLAFFYCEFGDDEKKNSRGLMSSLLFQLHDQSQSYSEILSKFYSEHRNGSQDPSDAALARCLNDIFRCAEQPPIYVIVDALDECPKAYGTPTPRGKVLKLVEELVCLNLPNLRICVTSRPETDIGAVLNRLKSHFVSLDEEGGQRQDIEAYVRSVVDSDLVIGTWGEEEKTLVTGALLKKGDRMFKWVSCQFDFLRRYPPERIRRALEELPDTLDGTYERSLRDIDEAIWDYAHRLFQCMVVASRPFHVEELAEFLAFDFEAGEIPKLVEDRRRKDPIQAVLTTCSSLITIAQEHRWNGPSDSKLVQFSHFSVKEFLMSGRLAAAQMPTIRRYNVLTTPAHTMVAKACLGTLLHPDEKLTDDSLKELPLAQYAARHWVDHALFENVSVTVQEGMKRLFDPTTRHFGAWRNVNVYHFRTIQLPLHLAVHYGLCDIAEFLIVQRAQNVNARQSDNRTPLSIASAMGNGTITEFLLQHGADTNPRDNNSCIPLNLASQRGQLEVVQILISHGADLNSQDDRGSTPLHSSSVRNHWEVAKALLEYGADASVHDKNSQMPLHVASKNGYLKVAQLLLDHGADANALDRNARTALHLALNQHGWREKEHSDLAKVLIECGTSVNAQDKNNWTPLHIASRFGYLDTARLLLDHGADANALDNDHVTPLHLASQHGHLEIAQLLLRGVNHDSRDKDARTAIHLVSDRSESTLILDEKERSDLAKALIECGANVNSQDKDNRTPLDFASKFGYLDTARLLLDHGADANALDDNHVTPLHLASKYGHLEIVQLLLCRGANHDSRDMDARTALHLVFVNPRSTRILDEKERSDLAKALIECGANVNSQDKDNRTPLHFASIFGYLDTARLLLYHGADANALDNDHVTPLHMASERGHLEIVQLLLRGPNHDSRDMEAQPALHLMINSDWLSTLDLVPAEVLIECGANVNVQDTNNWTPLHFASNIGCLDTARLLLYHGADANALDNDHVTPLHLASERGHLEIVQLLLRGPNHDPRDDEARTALHLALNPLDFSLGNARNPFRSSTLEFLVPAQVPIECGANVNVQDTSNWTPLHFSSNIGCLDIARLLLDHGADANALDSNHVTPLHLASERGHLEIVQLLLLRGANHDSRDKDARTALHLTLNPHWSSTLEFKERSDLAKVLIECGANVNSQDTNNRAPLHFALEVGYLDTARLLLDHGADANALDDNHVTPLHLASGRGHLEIVQLLLRGPNHDPRDDEARTALHLVLNPDWSSTLEFLVLAQVLIERGANVNAQDTNNWTPLHFASNIGCLDTARLLLDHGADPNALDSNHVTPIHLASERRHLEIVQLLLLRGANHDADVATPLIGCVANVNSRGTNNPRPLHFAPKFGYADLP